MTVTSRGRALAGLALALWVTAFTTGDAAQPAPAPFSCPPTATPANLNFTLKDLNGKDVKLSAYKGKVILLDFWATWCAPCKVEIPWFIDYQQRLGAQGLQVVGISVDDDWTVVKPYVAKQKMNYPVLQGAGRQDVQDAFGPIEVFPTTLLISREGKVCATHVGLSAKESFDAQLASLLRTR